jgi:hypothetical protein
MIRQVLSPDPFRGYGGKIVKFDDYLQRSLELKAGDFAVQFVETFYDNHRRFRVEMTGDSLLGSPGKIRRLKVTDKASGVVIDISYSEDLDGNFVVLDGPGFLTKEGCKYIRYSIVYYVLGRDSKAKQLLYRRREARMRKVLFK